MKRQPFGMILACSIAACALLACSNDLAGTGEPVTGEPCANGEQKCEGTAIVECDGEGGFVQIVDCAATDQVCRGTDGGVACADSGVEPPGEKCAPGAKKCGDAAVLVCNDAGSYEIETACGGETPKCDVVDGAAQCVADGGRPATECEAGKSECDGDILKTCSEDGHWLLSDCSEQNGKCEVTEVGAGCSAPVATECVKGAMRCNGNVAEICRDDGSGFEMFEDCASNAEGKSMCEFHDGVAACTANCAQGYKACSGNTVVVCNDEGVFEPESPCDAATQICVDDGTGTAACESKPSEPEKCTPGTSYCDASGKRIFCNAEGVYETTDCTSIGEAYQCRVDGENLASCVEILCEEGTAKCNTTRYLMKCVDGKYESEFCPSRSKEEQYRCTMEDGIADCRKQSSSAIEQDSDGDGISDVVEGRFSMPPRDTDGDTVPDYLDWDSDGDTIPDAVEGVEDDDGDGIPNYLDTDSDNNGIPDMYEGCPMADFVYTGASSPVKDKGNDAMRCNTPIDTDGDTIPDYLDSDNDDDGIVDIIEIRGQSLPSHTDPATFSGNCRGGNAIGSAANPVDCNMDGMPDYMSADSDGDTLPDAIEGGLYKNGVYARYNLDSDGDGISDSMEGQPIVSGKLPDSDGDGIPDILEIDSDGDGLPDIWEEQHKSEGFDRTKKDSDGDGVDDLIEYGAGTKPNDPSDNPQSRGNFVFVVPYEAASTPEKQTLSFETAIQTVDLYFAFDQSGSMHQEFRTLGANLDAMLNTLRCENYGTACEENNDCSKHANAICAESKTCIQNPKLGDGCFDSMWTGFGIWGDVNKFMNLESLQSSSANMVSTLKKFYTSPNYNGDNDSSFQHHYNYCGMSENMMQPIACIIGGNKYCKNASKYPLNCYAGSDRFGCVGFRNNAIKIIIEAGDEDNYETTTTIGSTTYNWKVANARQWGELMRTNNVRYVGLWGSADTKNKGMKQLAQYAGSCAKSSCINESDNNLYITQITDTNLNVKAVDMIRQITKNMPIQITTAKEDIDPGASKLIDKLVLNTSGNKVQNRICTLIGNTITPTGKLPGIKDLLPGTSVCYDVFPVQNQSVFPATDEPQVKKARVYVKGDGSVLNSGIAYFLIPPKIEETNH